MVTLLGKYLRKHGLRQIDFSRAHGFAQPMVSQWSTGERRPGLNLAFAIEKATGGEVPASYWSTMETGAERARRRGGRKAI